MENRFAGFWIRAAAYIIDSLIYIAVSILFISIFGIKSGESSAPETIVLSLIYILYYPIMHSSKWQATIGKKLLKIYVIKKDGTKLSFLRALARIFSTIISLLPLYLGYIWAGFDKKKRTFHDMICGTYVVKR